MRPRPEGLFLREAPITIEDHQKFAVDANRSVLDCCQETGRWRPRNRRERRQSAPRDLKAQACVIEPD